MTTTLPSRSSRRLLLVEDDPATASALRSILARKGWAVDVAATLTEAMARLEPAPDWVVLDLMLPDGDGVSLLKKIRTERLEIRVAVTSGSIDRTRLDAVARLGADAFFSKPVDLPQLLNALSSPA